MRKEAAAVIIRNDKKEALLLRRGNACRNEIGKWENPGGEIDGNESPEDCVRREAKEEIGVELEIERKLFTATDKNGWTTTVFAGHIKKSQPTILEQDKISEFGWYSLKKTLAMDLTSYTRVDFQRIKALFPTLIATLLLLGVYR